MVLDSLDFEYKPTKQFDFFKAWKLGVYCFLENQNAMFFADKNAYTYKFVCVLKIGRKDGQRKET